MNEMEKILFIFSLAAILLFPLISLAGQYIADGYITTYDGLVPCGREVRVSGAIVTIPCQLCHVFVMLKGIFDSLLMPPTGIVFLIGFLMIIAAGVMFIIAHLISPDNPDYIKKAQGIITSVAIGFIIIFSAWLFVNTFFIVIGVADWTGLRNGWFAIKCNVKLPEGYVPLAGSLALINNVSNVNIGESFDVGVNFNTSQPVSNMNMDVNFSGESLVLINIIPTAGSNFKTFLPSKNDGSFDIEKVISDAKKYGIVSFGATCFDFNTFACGDFQDGSLDSFVTLVFKAKKSGTGSVQIDSENSKLVAAAGDIAADILKKEDSKIEITIN